MALQTSTHEHGDYGLDALPYGVFEAGVTRRVGVRLGDSVVDLAALARATDPDFLPVFDQPTLDALLSAGRNMWDAARARVVLWLTDADTAALVEQSTYAIETVRLHMPFTIADYVDFFSSRDHAENLSGILRPGQPALQPNWLSLPVGYHGRAGTVVPSGTPIVRPSGQRPASGSEGPSDYGPTRKLDVEVEVGFVVGTPSVHGGPGIGTGELEDHVFGVVLVNDWSARDIQAFEYVPLGPMLGKSFATSIGAWVLPLSALHAARVPPPERVRPLLPYLRSEADWGLDIELELSVNRTVVSRPSFKDMYWTPDQQLAHLTVNGANARTGDLFASGTVSSPGNFGSLIELTGNGESAIHLGNGSTRTFLQDFDEVVISASAPGPGGGRIGLGEVQGRILPHSSLQ